MDIDVKGINVNRLPVNREELKVKSWHFEYTKSHILSSKCTNEVQCDKETPIGKLCLFCKYVSQLDLPHLPDMVFPRNILTVTHESGCVLEFNAFDSLLNVSNGKQLVTVSCSEAWHETRAEGGHTKTVVKPFDWTFSTDYKGTFKGDWTFEDTELRIDINKLRQREELLFYHELLLFEDELHDNGTASLIVKFRVMPSCFFILLRYFLRVDRVLIKINDTRIYHEFDNNYMIREYTSREAKVDDLKVPQSMFLDPNVISEHLPLIKHHFEKIIIAEKDNGSLETKSATIMVKNQTLMKIAAYGGIICGTTGLLGNYWMQRNIKQSSTFLEALQILRDHKGVQSLLGEPITCGSLDLSDKINNTNDGVNANFAVPVKGPKAKGKMYFWASKTSDTEPWNIQRLEFELSNDNTRRLLIKNINVSSE